MKKEKLIEILTEMMATSPSRNWDLEARSTKQQIEDMRNQNENHILEFTDIILEEIKMKNKKMKIEYIKENFEELKEGIKFELEKTLPQDMIKQRIDGLIDIFKERLLEILKKEK